MTQMIVLVLVILVGARASAQQLSDTQIADAIKAGESKKLDALISDCIATVGFGKAFSQTSAGGIERGRPFTVTTSGATGRVAVLAANGKRLYKPFTMADVTSDLRDPAAYVQVEPEKPYGNSFASVIQRVVLVSKQNPDAVVQPIKIDLEPVEWPHLMGAKVAGNRALARFEIAPILALPAGDIDVVVVTEDGERRCKIGVKDRTRVFAAQK